MFSQSSKPYGLITDLLEHTEMTCYDGYASDIPVWQADIASLNPQFAEIRSRFPSFSWIVPSTKNTDIKQVAYHIIVSDSYQKAESLDGNIWDSGEITSNASSSVIYGGKPLESGKNYFWRVKSLTNASKNAQWSDIKAFRTAMEMKDYAASFYPLVKTRENPLSIKKISVKTTLIDFGKDAFGQLFLWLESDVSGQKITVHLGEALKNGRIDREPEGTIRYRKYELTLTQGLNTYRITNEPDKRNTGPSAIKMPDYIGEVFPFRYCEIEAYERDINSGNIFRDVVTYPFDAQVADFKCSNDTLNQIWELCKYSIKATSFTGIYIDGDRERIPYEADALINQLCHYGVDREFSMARHTSEYLLLHPTWPTEWIMQAVMIAWNDYLYTGDSRSLKENFDVLKARTLLALRESNGLISTKTGLQNEDFQRSIRYKGEIRDIVDWPQAGGFGAKGESDGFVFTDFNAVINAYHFETLKLMSRISEALNLQQETEFFRKEAENFKEIFNKLFYNSELGYYTDGVGEQHASLHANMFALAFGLVPENCCASVIQFIESRGMACSVYGAQFLLDALYNANDADYALKMLTKTDDRGWYNMLRVGSTITLEAWDNRYKPNQDWNHAWGAVPANIIPRRLVGVEPLSPAFDLVRIKPQIADLKFVTAKIPTIKGNIEVEIHNDAKNYSLTVKIPANMEAEVYLPDNKSFTFAGKIGSGKHKFKIKK
ncbi:MAG: family 78 glycoside hydrolase catalytic domain [Dysgonamonadaceae bacterium]|jgi:hypothetical protein|nr:family 78 glycoside hydrolase catalytic domain [Dysgonamonadaceae bacterium]